MPSCQASFRPYWAPSLSALKRPEETLMSAFSSHVFHGVPSSWKWSRISTAAPTRSIALLGIGNSLWKHIHITLPSLPTYCQHIAVAQLIVSAPHIGPCRSAGKVRGLLGSTSERRVGELSDSYGAWDIFQILSNLFNVCSCRLLASGSQSQRQGAISPEGECFVNLCAQYLVLNYSLANVGKKCHSSSSCFREGNV